ncbi:uncharacterized protein LOC142019808 [Carettochelys insculpta]|uniref:uncharacterized protein LOC142019808 n=1 Tax=Carettochelys insculpta TaxID=44489 RepID=UPI003EBB0236
MEPATSRCILTNQGPNTYGEKQKSPVTPCLYPVVEVRSQNETPSEQKANKLKRKRKETTENENSPASRTDGWMKPNMCSFPDNIVVRATGTLSPEMEKNQESIRSSTTATATQSSARAEMKLQDRPQLVLKDKTKDSDVPDGPVEEPLSSPENPEVYMERVRSWQRKVPKFGGSLYCEEFRFVNLEQINSAEQVVEDIHREIQSALDDVNGRIGPDDYVQLCLESRNLIDPLFSVRRTRDDLSAGDFLSQTSKLLQSNRELQLDGTLRLIATLIKNMGGDGRRILNSILSSQITRKKRRYLVNLIYVGTNLRFVGGLLAVMSDHKPTDTELLEGARKLHEKLGWSDQKKVMLSDVVAFEQQLGVSIWVVLYATKGGWGFFKTGGPVYPKTFFMLLHNEHYGVLDVKSYLARTIIVSFARRCIVTTALAGIVAVSAWAQRALTTWACR